MTRVLILGGGFGGITAARAVRGALPAEHHVTLVDEGGAFAMGLGKLMALDGRRPLAAGRRSLADLRPSGIEVVRERVARIDVARREVVVGATTRRYDHLVLALGAWLDPDAVPGFGSAHNLYDGAGVERLAAELQRFQSGRILFSIAATPFKCPPAPYEAALLTEALLRRRGVRRAASIAITTPEPRPLPVAPATCSQVLLDALADRGIELTTQVKPVEVAGRAIRFDDGSTREADLLVGVPVHRGPRVLDEAGLTDASSFVPADAATLATRHPDVYAVGDCNIVKGPSGKPLPKAGIIAEGEAMVVAANIAARILGREPAARFDGRGFCFVELGDGLATAVDGEFYATPEPRVTMRAPSAETLQEKERFESERLAAWFGR